MAATEIVAVLDAGPLIPLDELGRLGLLSDFERCSSLKRGWMRPCGIVRA